jgi:hypothetical protein
MNIKQALKRKNKLAGLMNEEFAKANKYNSVEEGNPRPYSAVKSLDNWMSIIDELVDLKTRIHTANTLVFEKIFRLAELKSQIKNLKSLDCTAGKHTEGGRWGNSEQVIRHSEITVTERDLIIKDLEAQIEHIQEELDVHNHNTEI